MIEKIITGDLGVNTYLYNYKENRAVVIDPGADPEKIISRIEENSLEVTGIILTHGHFDHIGAVQEIREKYGVNVYIHRDDADFIGTKGEERQMEMFKSMGPMGMTYFNLYYKEIDGADVILEDDETIDEFNLKVIHTPGHSPGSICLYDENCKILFSGDTLFRKSYGRTDFTGGDFKTLMKSLKRLQELPADTRVLPGHEGETTIGEESRL